jgi:hypothetical protein
MDGQECLSTPSSYLCFLVSNSFRSTIIRDNEQLAGATAQKYRYIRDQQVQHREQGMTYLNDADLPVLREWEDQMRTLDSIKEADAAANKPDSPETLVPEVDGR